MRTNRLRGIGNLADASSNDAQPSVKETEKPHVERHHQHSESPSASFDTQPSDDSNNQGAGDSNNQRAKRLSLSDFGSSNDAQPSVRETEKPHVERHHQHSESPTSSVIDSTIDAPSNLDY